MVQWLPFYLTCHLICLYDSIASLTFADLLTCPSLGHMCIGFRLLIVSLSCYKTRRNIIHTIFWTSEANFSLGYRLARSKMLQSKYTFCVVPKNILIAFFEIHVQFCSLHSNYNKSSSKSTNYWHKSCVTVVLDLVDTKLIINLSKWYISF